MNRYRAYYPIDDAPTPDGDGQFMGVNERLEPGQLPDGLLAHAENLRFENSGARTRNGTTILPWSHRISNADAVVAKTAVDATGVPHTGLTIPAPQPQSYGTVLAAAVWTDPQTQTDWLLVISREADGTNHAWRCRPNQLTVPIALPAGEVWTGDQAWLVPSYNGAVLLRGNDADPLYMASLDTGFQAIPQPSISTASALPRSQNGVYWNNRLLLVDARREARYTDTIWLSDIGGVPEAGVADATGTVLEGPNVIWNQFRINAGTPDRLTVLYPINASTILAIKGGSVYLLTGLTGTYDQMAANVSQQVLTTAWGSQAPRSVAQVGADVWLLADRRGVVSIRQTEFGVLQGVDMPVSRDMELVMQRINWSAAAGAVATFFDNRYRLALPLDEATTNTAVLNWNTKTGAWEGYDVLPFGVVDWVKMTVGGVQRLIAVGTDGFLHLYEQGWSDETVAVDGTLSARPIVSVAVTRGYGGRNSGLKKFGRLRLRVFTWQPSLTVATLKDGQWNPDTLRGNLTRDPARYLRPWGAQYDVTNAHDDALVDDREDYAVTLPVAPGRNGLMPDRTQEQTWAWPVRRQGEWLQVWLTNEQGRMDVRAVELDGTRGDTSYGQAN